MRTRKLNLKKETLAELTADELDGVVGAIGLTQATQCPCSDFAQCVPTRGCLTFSGC